MATDSNVNAVQAAQAQNDAANLKSITSGEIPEGTVYVNGVQHQNKQSTISDCSTINSPGGWIYSTAHDGVTQMSLGNSSGNNLTLTSFGVSEHCNGQRQTLVEKDEFKTIKGNLSVYSYGAIEFHAEKDHIVFVGNKNLLRDNLAEKWDDKYMEYFGMDLTTLGDNRETLDQSFFPIANQFKVSPHVDKSVVSCGPLTENPNLTSTEIGTDLLKKIDSCKNAAEAQAIYADNVRKQVYENFFGGGSWENDVKPAIDKKISHFVKREKYIENMKALYTDADSRALLLAKESPLMKKGEQTDE